MTDREFQMWVEFYRLCPFDDRARYFRPAALIAHAMSGADVGEMTAFLANDAPPAGMSAADLATMKAFGVTAPGKG